MIRKLPADRFIKEAYPYKILDVRTPAEYGHAHIPGAVNVPLFSNDERAEVGTVFKKDGQAAAIATGLGFVGPRMQELLEQARSHTVENKVLVHCWRGGKRSASVAWLCDFAGIDVDLLEGGYKAYRRLALSTFETPELDLVVLGGRTGSRKTEILHELRERGQQVVDLEALANHKGSAFGWIGEPSQPSTEQFENLLFHELKRYEKGRPVWIENESRAIGKVRVPDAFWDHMKAAPLIHLEVPVEERIAHLVSLYAGSADVGQLADSFKRIERRLGGQHCKAAVAALEEKDFATAARIALKYYDKTYDYNLSVNKSPHIEILKLEGYTIEESADAVARVVETLAQTTADRN